MNISIARTQHPRPRVSVAELGFGRHFADHMFLMNYSPDKGWHDAKIVPYGSLAVDPANLTLHYGQTIFEGLKAYRWADGSVKLFRPADHADRFILSAQRLCMPLMDRQTIMEAFNAIVYEDKSWVPSQAGTSLYLRPCLVAADDALGVRPSQEYLMYIITSPVASYYSRGMAPTRILVEDHYSRSAAGGLGEAKTAANYAASMLAAEQAKKKGFDQVLWLDSNEHRYIEEVGTMNIFFVIDGVLVTPPLAGTILNGVTRRTVLQLAREWNIPCEERPITIDEVVAASEAGTLQEAFGSGTAAVISPIGELNYRGRAISPKEPEASLRQRFYDAITGICYGTIPDTHGWLYTVHEPEHSIVIDTPLEDGIAARANGTHLESKPIVNIP